MAETPPGAPGFSLRPAEAADFPAIRALIRQVNINPLGLSWPNFILAVDANGQMIACGQIKRHGDGSHELASIAVIPEWRSKGVAGAVIHALLAQHPERLFLTCRQELGSFYRRFGFRPAEAAELTPFFRRLRRAGSVLRFLRLMPRNGVLIMVHARFQ